MLWYTYLFENGMFTNKKNAALLGKENAGGAGWVRRRGWG